MYTYTDAFMQINGQIYRVSDELISFDLFKPESTIIRYYGISDHFQQLFIEQKNGSQYVFNEVRNKTLFELQSGAGIDEVYRDLLAAEPPLPVDWLLEIASITGIIRLIETMQYNITIKTGLYCTEYPDKFTGKKGEIFLFEYIDNVPATRIK